MTILASVIHLAIPILLLFIPLLFYRKRDRRILSFYLSMADRPKCRKAYMLAIAMVALLYNFTFFVLLPASLWHIPGYLLAMLLLKNRLTDAMFRWLNGNWKPQTFAFVFIIISCQEPRLLSLTTTLALILTAAFFYPSQRILDHASGSVSCGTKHPDSDDMVDLYFATTYANLHRHSKTHRCRVENGTNQHQKSNDND